MMDRDSCENVVMTTVRSDVDAVSRRRIIVELVSGASIGSQAELAKLLADRGVRATQATLSRDLKALGIGKIPLAGEGYAYVLPTSPRDVVDHSRNGMELEAFVQEVRLVGNLALVRTAPGNAHGVGRVIDSLGWDEVKGTVSGDDTVLVVTDSHVSAEAFRSNLSEYTGRSFT